MKILHLDCKKCGAPMEVRVRKGGPEQLSCEFCGSQAFVAEQKDEPALRNHELTGQRGELQRLDSAWRRQRRSFEKTGQHGEKYIPSDEQVVGAIVAAGLAFVMMFAMFRVSSQMVIIPFVAMIIFAVSAVVTRNQVQSYEAARRRYRRRRREILATGRETRPGQRIEEPREREARVRRSKQGARFRRMLRRRRRARSRR